MKRKKLKLMVSKKVGHPPGSITYVGKERIDVATLELISYDETGLSRKKFSNCEDLKQNIKTDSINWINVDGVHDQELLNQFGSVFGLHHLLLEDVANMNQRPKVEEFDTCLFLSIKMLQYSETIHNIESEQVSIVLSKDYVITFQEKTGDVFGNIRDRIENSKGQIRKKGNDYLFYSFIDSIIDNYFSVIENVGTDLEELEDEVFNNPSQILLEKIQNKKNLLLILRRSIYPARESINKLLRDNSDFILPGTVKYFNDVYDHTIQIIDIIESYRDVISGLKDSYLSSISLKMNQIMQVLTIMATIFIPLTFIAGVYGMNFDSIPELKWQNGYYYFWGLTIFILLALIIYFRKRKWL